MIKILKKFYVLENKIRNKTHKNLLIHNIKNINLNFKIHRLNQKNIKINIINLKMKIKD